MENLCRICLSKDANIPIFESNGNDENVHNKIALCVREKVEDIEGYPRNICKPCNNILDSISLFVKKYKESYRALESGLVPVKHEDQSYEQIRINLSKVKTETDLAHGSVVTRKKVPPLIKIKRLANKEPSAKGPIIVDAYSLNGQSKILDIKERNLTTVIKKKLNIKLLDKQEDLQEENIEKSETTKKSGSNNNADPKSLEPKKSAQCTICSRLCASEYYLNRHMKRMHSENKSFECNYCSKSFAFKGELGSHIKATHTKTTGPPKIRKKKKKIPKPLKKKTDDGPNPPKLCDTCGDVFPTSSRLLLHKRKKHIEKPAKCTICGRVCASVYYVNRHMKRRHNDVKNFACSLCGRAFAYKGELTTHIKSVHVEKTEPPKTYSCKICGKTYKCSKSVVVHERAVHTGERPAVCKVCNARFTHEEYLRHHMRLHTGETPFKCPICGRGYSQSCNMKSHLRIHRISELDEATLRSLRPTYLKRLKKC